MFSQYPKQHSEPTIKPAGTTYESYRENDRQIPINPVHTPSLVLADHMNKVTEEIIASAVKTGKDQQGKD